MQLRGRPSRDATMKRPRTLTAKTPRFQRKTPSDLYLRWHLLRPTTPSTKKFRCFIDLPISDYLKPSYTIPCFASNSCVICISYVLTYLTKKLMALKGNLAEFEDFFPAMVEKLGAEGFLDELCNGFRLLMDEKKGLITLESLKKNSALLGLQDMKDDELLSMIEEGDSDGDGNLNEMEFCVLMFRLSPELMKTSRMFVEETILNES